MNFVFLLFVLLLFLFYTYDFSTSRAVFTLKFLFVFVILLYFYPTVEGFVEDYVVPTDPILRELREQLCVLHPAFENVRIYEGNKSYTVNKRRVYICLKDENGRYYPRNMLVYVILHEYAHILCDEVGHTPKFFDIFHQLLKRAESVELYDSRIPPIKNYCGHS